MSSCNTSIDTDENCPIISKNAASVFNKLIKIVQSFQQLGTLSIKFQLNDVGLSGITARRSAFTGQTNN